MGGELMKEYVGIAMRVCHKSASRHPLLAFMILVLIWIYRSFPTLFAFLVDVSPVIASTTVLLGILLFFGHSNAPEIQEGKPYHHKIHNLKFGVLGDTEIDWRGAKPERREKASRKKTCVVHRVNVNTDKLGSSIDNKFIQEAKSGVRNQKEKIILVNRCDQCQASEVIDGANINEYDKGWETGSELAESTSPTASMTDIFPLHDHPEVPRHAYMSNLSTDAESSNSEENDQGDIHVKEYEEKEKEKEEEDQKNLVNPFDLSRHSNENIIESAPSVSMARRSSSDISYDPSRQESDRGESVPSKPDNQFSDHHERIDVGPSTLMASKQGKEGYNLKPQFVPEPEAPDATNYSSMDRQVDELSDSNKSSAPDHTDSVGFPLTEDDPSREANFTSINEGIYTESVASSHYDDKPSRETDLISVKEVKSEDDSTSIKKGFYPESVTSSNYEDEPSRETDLISVKEVNSEDNSTSVKKGFYPESVSSSRYEDDPSQEADSTSVKEGFDSQSVGSTHYRDDPSQEADLISVKEGYYEDDYTSVKNGYYAESVASVYTEDDATREDDANSVKEGYYASEISDYVSQRSVSSDDDDTDKLHHHGRPDEVKTIGGGESDFQGKSGRESSSSPFSDVTDRVDDEEEDYHSVIMPLTSHSNDQKIQEQGKENSLNINFATNAEAVDSRVHDFESDSDHKQDNQSLKTEHNDSESNVHDSESDSTVSKPNEGRLPQTFSQVQQGLTSWFKWKA